MPKEYSHLYLGKELLAYLKGQDNAFQGNLKVNPSPFLFGNTAPDVFFYDFPSFRYRVLAKLLHRGKGEKLFEALVSMIERSKREDPGNMIYSFTLGCLSHLAADMTWHPLVLECCSACPRIPKAPECSKHMACHFRIESCLDSLLLNYYGSRPKKRDFSRLITLFKASTRQLIGVFCREINAVNDTPLRCIPVSAYRCLLTQVVFLTIFQMRPLFWMSLGADLLTLKKFDQYQALFYPPSQVMKKRFFFNLSPGLKMLVSSRDRFLEKYVSRTKRLALQLFDIASKQKTNILSRETAYKKFLAISPPTGVDGHTQYLQ